MQFEVLVELKQEVLDVEGRAIQETLARIGHRHLKKLRLSKRFVIEVDPATPNPEKLVESIARDYLANPVSETYSLRKLV